METNELKQERESIFHDVYNNIIPKRVPIDLPLMKEAAAEWAGMNVRDMNWNPAMIAGITPKVCETFYSDTLPVAYFSTRFPGQYEVTGSRSFIASEAGFVQHPEVSAMETEDYDYLISSPIDCLIERIIPRQYAALNGQDGMLSALALAKGIQAKNGDFFPMFGIAGKFNAMYGYYAQNGQARAMTTVPFDFIADQLRGFSKISMDIRRCPEKILEATEAVYPLMIMAGTPNMLTPESRAYSFTHMAPFMREKDFAKLYWPGFKKMCEEFASKGIQTDTFLEDDWTRYADYVSDLPANTLLRLEKGDMRVMKEKWGGKHIIQGMFPISLMQGGTKEQCLDKAKEMLDILAPGGRYIFAMDKLIITAGSVNFDNLIAVGNYVHENGSYSNAGETSGQPYRQEDYQVAPTPMPASKYFTTAQQYLAANPRMSFVGAKRMEATDTAVLNYIINLLF